MTASGGSAAARQSWTGAEAGGESLMSIGEVLAHLRPDFPDTTISKLRFLEAEGLVEPSRTPAGYRKYTRADLARLRYILTAQRDHYLPLRVIRAQLAEIDGGEPPARAALVALPRSEARPEARAGLDGELPATIRGLTRADLRARVRVDDDLLDDLERHGLVTAGPGGTYPVETVEVVAVAAALAEFGVHARHLRGYRAAADREVGMFTQVVAPLARGSGPAARARAAETVRELSVLTQRLHAALVRMGLTETLGH